MEAMEEKLQIIYIRISAASLLQRPADQEKMTSLSSAVIVLGL